LSRRWFAARIATIAMSAYRSSGFQSLSPCSSVAIDSSNCSNRNSARPFANKHHPSIRSAFPWHGLGSALGKRAAFTFADSQGQPGQQFTREGQALPSPCALSLPFFHPAAPGAACSRPAGPLSARGRILQEPDLRWSWGRAPDRQGRYPG